MIILEKMLFLSIPLWFSAKSLGLESSIALTEERTSLCKNQVRAFGGAKNMHPQAGDTNRKDQKFSYLVLSNIPWIFQYLE